MYTMISMTALLAAIWVGMWFAGRFVAPIRRLIFAAQQVSTGDLLVELPEKRGEGDLRRLSHTFNNMTRELKHQRDALVTANEQLLDRRRFMEAVLSGVSAGVIGLDSQGRITLLSRSAEQLLGTTEAEVVGKRLSDVLPVFAALLRRRTTKGMRKPRGQQEISFPVNGEDRTFAVRVTREKAGPGDVGSVVTFDDITELVSAQRTSAWADVARRIAHEIKNPLTPIILSAERLRRKYGKVITGPDRETFDKLTATIERQAGDIKTMVDEFASFARVPKPVIETQDLRESVLEPVVLFREGHPGVSYNLVMPEGAGDRVVRSPADHASRHQSGQERHRGGRSAGRGTGQRLEAARRGRAPPDGGRDRHRGHRQRRRPAEAEPLAALGALRHDQGPQGHRARPRHRAEDHRAAWRLADAGGRAGQAGRRAARKPAHWCASHLQRTAHASGHHREAWRVDIRGGAGRPLGEMQEEKS